MKKLNIENTKIGFWTVLRKQPGIVNGHSTWVCQCVCGTIKTVGTDSLTRAMNGATRHASNSCGCRGKQSRTQVADTELAWAAGFFDGEGTVGLAEWTLRGKGAMRQTCYLRVQVRQKALIPLLRLNAIWKGNISKRSPINNYILYGRNASFALSQMLPYLCVKKEQAQLGIEFQQIVINQAKSSSQADCELRQSFRVRLKELNKVTPVPKELAIRRAQLTLLKYGITT